MRIFNFFIPFFCLSVLFACSNKDNKEDEQVLPSIIEIVSTDSIINPEKLNEICKKYKIPETSVFQWKNHLIIYDAFISENIENIRKDISTGYPGFTINWYEKPYYIFDRNRCDQKGTAEKWHHTIMTANLVQDTVMQQEYMNYHATQFEKWPEISYGFCKAEFQQLLMFRNGRQLMLIISIPEGKTLDELDPKTTEDNPKVDEWNSIMAKYQEGIEGSAPNEKWVLFTPVITN